MSCSAVLCWPCKLDFPQDEKLNNIFWSQRVWYNLHTHKIFFPLLSVGNKLLWPCMVRNGPHTHTQKKALHHWIVLQISHLAAIPFGVTLLGRMLAEVRDMLDDIRVKAGWRAATFNFTQWRRNTGFIAHLSFLSASSLPSYISFSFHLSSRLSFTSFSDESSNNSILCCRCPEGSFIALSHLSQFQPPTQPPRARSEKMENVFCLS